MNFPASFAINLSLIPLMIGLTTFTVSAEPATRADKVQILAWAKSYFADPYSLRSTEISDRTVVKGVPVVCIAFNGKNGYGAYTGIDDMPFEITSIGLKTAVPNFKFDTATCRQPNIVWRPFPELSQIR